MTRKLNDKQRMFVKEYLVDLNATQAALRAGYSEKTAKDIGCQNLAKLNIATAIQKAMEKRSDRTEITADYVLNRLVQIDKMSVRDIMNDDMTLKPLSEWPDVWCSSISAIDVSEVAAGQQDAGAALSFIKKLKWPDALKPLELLGKHLKLFTDKVEHGVDDRLATLLSEIDGKTPPLVRDEE